MPNVRFVRADLMEIMPDYVVVNDCIDGQRVIKRKREIYLPKPDPEDRSPENDLRYDAYRTRAVFYNFTGRTRDGLVGEVFLRSPVVELPTALKPIVDNANGDGASLTQLAKETVGEVLAKGRAGLFVDYPNTNSAPTTVAQQQAGFIRPTITFYKPENIINWRTKKIGARILLTLVVLQEVYDRPEGEDPFVSEPGLRYRVLQLVNGVYTQTLYTDYDLEAPEVINVLDASGKPLREIPFTFVGIIDNSDRIHPAPMLPLAELNVAHYRNSADYEEGCYLVGQPTPVATGLNAQWVSEVLHGELRFGSRGGIPLPAGATFQIAQVQPNSMAKEAMDQKEEQAVALGAKLVKDNNVSETATEVMLDNAAETSVLTSAANNVTAALQWSLAWAGVFTGDVKYSDDLGLTATNVKFQLNTDFNIMRMSWQERQQMLKEWQANAITTHEYRANLRQAGIATLPDDQFDVAYQQQVMEDLENQAKAMGIAQQSQQSSTENAQTGGTPEAGKEKANASA